MKALIRNEGETVTEDSGLSFINWQNGAPLTNPEWYGGPYTLISDYVPAVEEDLDMVRELNQALHEETVTIDGKEYTVEEAREILGVKL